MSTRPDRTSRQPVFLDEEVLKRPSSSFPEPHQGNVTWHTLISAPTTPSSSLSAGIAECPANGSLALHRHKQAEMYYVLSGSGEVEVDGKRRRVCTGMMVWIPGDSEHGVFCGDDEQLKWLYVFPEGSFEDVVYRFTCSPYQEGVERVFGVDSPIVLTKGEGEQLREL